MGKIKTLSELGKIAEQLEKEGKTIGLITGCFDILHFGHIELFRFAKRRVDVLVVGIDNDKSVKLSKGQARPCFPQEIRVEVLAEQESINYAFVIKRVYKFDLSNVDLIQESIIKKLRPTRLFTYIPADMYWKNKKRRAKKLGIEFVGQKRQKKPFSSSKIIKKLELEV